METDDDETVTTGVLLAVSAVSGRQPTDLPLLNDVIDGDALDALFSHPANGVRLTFRYADYLITVSDGTVTVHEPNVTHG